MQFILSQQSSLGAIHEKKQLIMVIHLQT